MQTAATLATAFVALLHVYIFVLESFLWTTIRGRRTFGMTRDFAETTAPLAKNQGVYNAFLAAGLVWGLTRGVDGGRDVITFFLACVAFAGLVGGLTVNKRILLVQTVPALLALALVWM